jgi:predicted unusual protein kinase regulating ubiquinone biosynthesis (AarF/ABC1/UbiB family)
LGGTNDSTNLVTLTAREHYIAHWLLIKTAVIMQGVGLALDPEFDIFKAAQRAAELRKA